jgi:Uma2 family endonuclease
VPQRCILVIKALVVLEQPARSRFDSTLSSVPQSCILGIEIAFKSKYGVFAIFGYTAFMPRVAEQTKIVTVAEYLEFEETAMDKHEFVDGQIFAMAGASDAHNRVALRLAAMLLEAETESCRTYSSDMKLQIGDIYYYPDVLVTCSEADLRQNQKTQPCAIIEVLSSSTADIDRGEKWQNYQKLESLKTYVLLDQTKVTAEVFQRLPDDAWRYEKLELGSKLKIPCLNLEIALEDIYRGIEF